MKIRDDYLLNLKPLKKYDIPKYPIFDLARDNPELLKKLPSRWQKNAKVIGCLGIVGMLTLTGCPPFFPGFHGNNKCPDCGFSHNGGSGGAPIYIIYLTEQEALTLIQSKAEAAGLDMSAEPPDYTVSLNVWNQDDLGLKLYDESKDVALTIVNMYESGSHWCNVNMNKTTADNAKKEFAKFETGTTIGVFYNPAKPIGYNDPDEKTLEDANKSLSQNLSKQVQDFIIWMQSQGIIQ